MHAEYLGFNNKTCSAGTPPKSKVYGDTVGPLLRNYFDSKQWKTWDMDVLSSNTTSAVVTLMNYYTGKGEPKCKDYYMADYYDKKGACSDDPWAERVHLHKEAQEWTLYPVPDRDECFYIVNDNKPEGCWRFLSARKDCDDPYVRLAAGDDGSGNQRWKLVHVDPSPPPSPSPPSPSPSPSPVPSPPAPSAIPGPTIKTTSDTAPRGVVVVLVESFGGNTECRVRNVQFTFTPSSAPWAAQVVEVGAVSSLQTSGLREVLSQSGIYTIQAVGKCSDGRSTLASNTVVSLSSLFYLDRNGITVLCPDAPVGSSGEVNGVMYTKVDEVELRALANDDTRWASLPTVCTSGIADMSALFYDKADFEEDIGSWDTTSVTDTDSLFYGASAFNQPLNKWDTSSVITMGSMFYLASAFNQPLNEWDTSSVTDMSNMFAVATAFNQSLNEWDTSSVTTMSYMFFGATAFNQPLNEWNTSSVTDMSGMFDGAFAFNQSLNEWDTSSVTDMSFMFRDALAFNQNLTTWNTDLVYECISFSSGATSWSDDLKPTFTNC